MNADWNQVFGALPDSAFFELVRHYLGELTTPFHKPRLMDRMVEFFHRQDVVRRVEEYFGIEDARVLTFIALIDHPTEKTLARIIPDMRFVELQEKLYNLEERLLVWRNPDRPGRPYALTPLGLAVRDRGLIGPGTLIGEGVEDRTPAPPTWVSDGFLMAALAFLAEGVPLFLKEGGWRKKTMDLLRLRFPVLFRDNRGEERIILTGRGLIGAGLAVRRGEFLTACIGAWRKLEHLDAAERHAFMLSHMAVGRTLPPSAALNVIHALTECLPAGRFYPVDKLATLVQLIAGGEYPLSHRGAERILAHLELMGELTKGEEGRLGRMGGEHAAGRMSITPVGDISLPPGAPLFCDLALSTEPVSVDVAATFRWNKNHFLAGLDAGVNTESLFSGIERHCGREAPENLLLLAAEWESEYRAVALNSGVLLQVQGMWQDIIDQTGVLNAFNRIKLSSGLWLLDAEEETGWRAALKDLGIHRLPPIRSIGGKPDPSPPSASPSSTGAARQRRFDTLSWDQPAFSDSSFTEFAEKVDSLPLDQKEREAFHKQLNRRLILSPDQIRPGLGRYEVMTAKGFDYRGKIRLVEAALNGRNDRLIVTLSAKNELKTVLVKPKKLEKDGSDHVLLGLVLPEEEPVRYKIRKIGLLKRVKASLF